MSVAEIADVFDAVPPGTSLRQGTNSFLPTQVPDLIGVKDRKYLDHTGLERQRDIGDLMRYAALNQDADALRATAASYRPMSAIHARPAPDTRMRYSDEQLYALTLYSIRSSHRQTRTHLMRWPSEDSRSSSEKAAPGVTRRRSTRTTSSRRLKDSSSPAGAPRRFTTSCVSRWTDPTWRCGRGGARVITRCRRSKDSGTGACFRTTARGDARGLVRSGPIARRLRADRLQGIWHRETGGPGARVRATSFGGGQTSAHRIPEDAVIAALTCGLAAANLAQMVDAPVLHSRGRSSGQAADPARGDEAVQRAGVRRHQHP